MAKKKNTIPIITLDDDDFGVMLNCAVRYSLGRSTYMPQLVIDFITPLLPYLSDRTIYCLRQDIGGAESYGHELVDKPNWAAFYDLVKNEYSKRTKGA